MRDGVSSWEHRILSGRFEQQMRIRGIDTRWGLLTHFRWRPKNKPGGLGRRV
jgi:hypothetical protein